MTSDQPEMLPAPRLVGEPATASGYTLLSGLPRFVKSPPRKERRSKEGGTWS